MRRRFRWDKKYLHWGVTAFCVIAASILFFMALNYIPVIGEAIAALFRILSPFIWGLFLTYLLAPLMKALEKNVFKPLISRMYRKNKKRSGTKLARALSVFVSEVVLIAILTLLVYLIIPQLYSSIETIVSNSNTYINVVSTWIEKQLADYPEIEKYVSNALERFNAGLMEWLSKTVLPGLGSFVSNVAGGVYVFLRGLYNLIVGIIVSVYILAKLELFNAGFKRLMYCIFTVEAADKIYDGIHFTDRTFMGFISGKLLDSAIIGLICYIFCAITNMPYALLVSVIIGVTNIIPFFGPFIGAVPTGLIILLTDPVKCLIFVIFIIILQQIDGNIIGPKILGNSTGISGFWVMFSIILGAGLFRFWGMLLGVPVFVVIYTLVNSLVKRKLERSDLPVNTEDYLNVERIDPVTRDIIMKPGKEDASAEEIRQTQV
ncbi:MAG: AI-2E family transporter [Oscillospiraceae bacterium]|nr:AI-2E family transporter [Oscillospiraceae bacterium]